MGHTNMLLTLMTASLVASQQQSPPCDGSLGCLISQVVTPNPGSGSGNSAPSQVQPLQSGANPVSGSTDNCVCVPYYQCQNNTVITDGIGLIDIRLKGTCDNYLDVCCMPPDVLTPENKVTPLPIVRQGCGQRNPDGVGFRITGHTDNEAQFGEFPWMVAILREEVTGAKGEKLNVYQCGGSLIHPRAVLTAAHCVNGRNAAQLKIRAGEWDTQTKTELFPHQDREVEEIIVHEHFHSGSLWNDVAILILKTPVDFAENVDIVCLPPHNQTYDGSRCFASGWGKDIFGKEGHYQVILKRVELPVVNRDVCETTLRTTRLGKYFKLDGSFICAGGEVGKDTCKGDGGSPLVCPSKENPSRYVQTGIVAWGIGCGEMQIPGVYANVAHLRDWVDEQMVYRNFDITGYQL